LNRERTGEKMLELELAHIVEPKRRKMSTHVTFANVMMMGIALAILGIMPAKVGQREVQGQKRTIKINQPPDVNSALSNRQVIAYEHLDQGYGPDLAMRALYFMNSDGTAQNRIPIYGGGGVITRVDPALSPDGSRIAFASNPDLHSPLEIFTMNLDGSGIVRLTTGGNNRQPAWSPDGSLIAFKHTEKDAFGQEGIYLMTAGGGGLHALPIYFKAVWPTWSPDGSRLLYIKNSTGGADAESYSFASHQVVVLTYGAAAGSKAAWSPDGSKIAFSSNLNELCLINADGTGYRSLTIHGLSERGNQERNPSWSPDGLKIAYEHLNPYDNPPNGSWNIFVVDAIHGDQPPGHRPIQLTTGNYNFAPSWVKLSKPLVMHP
jgi:Tol biopolymer transport system component